MFFEAVFFETVFFEAVFFETVFFETVFFRVVQKLKRFLVEGKERGALLDFPVWDSFVHF